MKKILLPLLLLIGSYIQLTAQEKSHKELKGDKLSFRYSYSDAIKSYNAAKQLSVEGQRHLAEAYHKLDSNKQSEVIYDKVIQSTAGVLPLDYYNYANVLKSNGKYIESAIWMEKFVSLKPDDLRAKSFAENKASLGDLQKDDGKYRVKHLALNTDAEDFGTSYYNNQIVFTSSRTKNKMIVRNYNWTGKPFWDMYVADVDSNHQLTNVQDFSTKLNGHLHDGPASFSNKGTVIAFSRNNYSDHTNDKIVEIQIWFSSFVDQKWTNPTPFIYNNSEYSVGQPFLTKDGSTLYFTSDMPGGFGGADIYKSLKDDQGQWGKPQNLGSDINTEGDEMFPFLEESNQILFFSSNGRFGLGGLDIFIAEINGDHYGKVYNAGAPLNSQSDDFSVIVNDKMTVGYFSSNRVGGNGSDDIYGVDFVKALTISKKISGIAKNSIGFPIAKTFVTLLDDKGEIIDTVTTKEDAAFSFSVKKDKKFKLTGTNKDYIKGDTIANTFGKEVVVKVDIILLKKADTVKATPVVVAEKIRVGANLAKVLAFSPNTIYFDYGKWNIRADAIPEMDNIVKVMNEHPTMVVELGAHTDCRSSVEFNQRLSERRAKTSAAYIQKRITNPTRITGKGYGKSRLLNKCECDNNVKSTCTEAEHQINRRTEFIIVKE